MATEKISKKPQSKKRLVLLDAHAILHRAYHALPDFSSSKGEPTGALYGLASMLIKIMNELKPDYLAAAYDLPGPTYRHDAYDGYKATRQKADDALIAQMNRSRDVFSAFGVPIYEKPGFEADDVLGTIVEQTKKDKNTEVLIASGDMDTLQLVDDKKVQVYTLKKGIKDTIIYDEAGVLERFGFPPKLLPDYKGLRGDPSDNIVGIRGIGEKTATTLIKEFGTIEAMYKALKKDKERFKKIGITPRVIELLEAGEEEALFSKMLATIHRKVPIEFKLPPKSWKESFDGEKAENFLRELEFRTLSVRAKQVAPTQQGLMMGEESAPAKSEDVDPLEFKKIALATWILDSNLTNPTLEDIYHVSKKKTFKEAAEVILKEIDKQGLGKVYREIELPLIPVVERMEKRGIKIDVEYLTKLSKEFHKELEKHEKEIWKQAGEEFNINSPKQLSVILFEKLNLSLKNHKKTGSGVKSTKESELEKMREMHPIIGTILEYRELQKLLSTYIDNIPKMVAEDGRLHAKFLLAGSTTGRMSSKDPNLQNIPIKSEQGRKIRRAFVADKGYKLVAFDYSQIELRIAAFLSGDEKLIKIFKDGGDIHAAVASEVFHVPQERVDKEMRRQAKVINFGILYGMGVNSLRAALGTTRELAQNFYNEYFETFKTLASYLEKVKAETAKKGYTETLYGRKRSFEGIRSKIPYIRASAERMAINAPIQGTEADIVKLAMSKIEEKMKTTGHSEDAFPLLQVHDELVFEIKDSLVEKLGKEIKDIMENEIVSKEDTKGVPILVHYSAGTSWGEME